MTLRGTFGLNARREADKNCRLEHLEAILEPVPTFAPVNAPQIAMAHLSADLVPAADLVPEAVGPLPFYRAKLDGVVTLPPPRPPMDNGITINLDKTTYRLSDAITVELANNTNQAITTYDLKSYCSIVQLQRQDGKDWEDVGQWLLKRRSFPITIKAGETKRVVLEERENTRDAKKRGTYRLVLYYLIGAEANGESGRVVSSSFLIN